MSDALSAPVAIALAAALGVAVAAQEVPRTSWGDPDLQGIWVGSTLTPLERPYGTGPWHSHIDLDTGERCFGDGLPQIWFGENPNHQIFQTPTDVVILHEMYHQRRIIPIDGRPRTGIPQWNGEPRGRWEGSTLVVESRYFPDRSQDRFRHIWRAPATNLHVVERFTRVDADTIDYEATITDPFRFSQPWTVRFPLSADQSGQGVTPGHLFEYACHEGNYAIVNVLRGARLQGAHAAPRWLRSR